MAAPPRSTGMGHEVALLIARRARHFALAPGRVIGVLANPVIYLLVFTVLFSGALVVPAGYPTMVDYVAPGVALIVALSEIPTGAIALRLDLSNGLMDRMRSLPTRRASIIVSFLLSETLLTLVVTALVLGLARLLGWEPPGLGEHLGVSLALLVVFAFLCAGIAVLVGLLLRSPTTIDSVAALITVVLAFFSNALVPITAQPPSLQAITAFNPMNPVVDSLRRMWHFGELGDAGTVVLVMLGCTLALGVALVALFDRGEQ